MCRRTTTSTSYGRVRRSEVYAEVVSEQTDIETTLAEIAASVGAELHAQTGARTVAPIPKRTADGFVNQKCPLCGGEQFWHSYGDLLCRCASCGAVLDADDLSVLPEVSPFANSGSRVPEDDDPDPTFAQPRRPV